MEMKQEFPTNEINESDANYFEIEDFVNSDWDCGKTLLHIAVENDNIELVEQSIQLGADVNKVDDYGNTALFYCDSIEMAEILIKHNIDVDISNICDDNAVNYIYNGWNTNLEVAKYLISFTNLDSKNSLLEYMICQKCKDLSLFELVIKKTNLNNLSFPWGKYLITAVKKKGITYLMTAAKKRDYKDVIILLAKSGIDLHVEDDDGKDFYDLCYKNVQSEIKKQFPEFMKEKEIRSDIKKYNI